MATLPPMDRKAFIYMALREMPSLPKKTPKQGSNDELSIFSTNSQNEL